MTRKKKLLLNMITGVLKQLVALICGFVLPRHMLLHYGSTVNGLIVSITNFLGFISLLDMGVGAVIQANLYKPLADKDINQISRILKSSERFFRRLACIFLGYIVILCVAVPSTVKGEFNAWYTVSLLLIISISTFAQYMFGLTYQLLLNADQKSYISLLLQTGTITLNTLLSIVLMRMGVSIHGVKLMTAIIYVLRPVAQMVYVKRQYSINRKIQLEGEPIKQKWNGFSQHLAAVITENVDTVVLTLFSTLENVSIYSVYYSITNGVQQIIMTAATGLESFFGSIIANNQKDVLRKTFAAVEWVVHTGVTIVFTIALITIIPFVTVYTQDITDANYISPAFGSILILAYAVQCLRVPYFRVIKAAGHFKETQNGAYISALLNVCTTIALVFRYGLIGVAIGTFAAMLYHTCYFAWYLRNEIICRPITVFMKYIVIDCAVVVCGCFLGQLFAMDGISYASWVLFAVKVAAVVISISIVINIAVFREQMKDFIKMIEKK